MLSTKAKRAQYGSMPKEERRKLDKIYKSFKKGKFYRFEFAEDEFPDALPKNGDILELYEKEKVSEIIVGAGSAGK